MDADVCEAESFIVDGEKNTVAYRRGLKVMLETVAEHGLAEIPDAWSHEASKQDQVYEFIKGPLRLFYFKGVDGQIAVCTSGVRKSGKKADKASVSKAAALRKAYMAAHDSKQLEIIES